MSVGVINDPKLCQSIHEHYIQNPVVFWKVDESNSLQEEPVSSSEVHVVQGSDAKEILEGVLSLLPNPKLLDETDFQVHFFEMSVIEYCIYCVNIFKEARKNLRLGIENPWLICFYMGTATELNLQLKRLPTLLPGFNIGKYSLWFTPQNLQILIEI